MGGGRGSRGWEEAGVAGDGRQKGGKGGRREGRKGERVHTTSVIASAVAATAAAATATAAAGGDEGEQAVTRRQQGGRGKAKQLAQSLAHKGERGRIRGISKKDTQRKITAL